MVYGLCVFLHIACAICNWIVWFICKFVLNAQNMNTSECMHRWIAQWPIMRKLFNIWIIGHSGEFSVIVKLTTVYEQYID